MNIFSKSRLENFSFFYIVRSIYKKLMRLNGIQNISLIFINNTYQNNNYHNDSDVSIFRKNDDLKIYSFPHRLQNDINDEYFSKGSLLFAIIKNGKVIAYSWLHNCMEPDGDIDMIDIDKYYSIGPYFTCINYRNKGLSKKLNNAICRYAKEKHQYPIFTGIQIDNIPMIKAKYKSGYKLCNVIIRLKNEKPIIIY